MKTITLYVSGTHCNSCKIFIEDTLNEQMGITHAEVDLNKQTVSFDTDHEDNPTLIAELLTKKIEHNGYRLTVEKPAAEHSSENVIWYALPIGLTLLALFFITQRSGILDFGLGGAVTPLTSFIIGLVASLSSCLAVVGGLVLSLSAAISQDQQPETRPILLFHGGRLLGFALLGGALGAIGAAISISFTATAILGLIASLVMILLGLNLVGVFKRGMIALPDGAFRFFRNIEHNALAPLLVGIGTFFLPCGFTQAMQISALSSGSFFSGMFLMGAFALGTLPVLLLLSYGSASFARSKHAPLFFKTVGVVVIGLGTFAFLGGLVGLGIIDPIFNL